MYIVCVLCLFSALSRRVDGSQIFIIIIIIKSGTGNWATQHQGSQKIKAKQKKAKNGEHLNRLSGLETNNIAQIAV